MKEVHTPQLYEGRLAPNNTGRQQNDVSKQQIGVHSIPNPAQYCLQSSTKRGIAVHLDVCVEALDEVGLGLFLWHAGVNLADLHKHGECHLTIVY